MKELPEEVWTIVAQHAKRVPPPACTTANWNDHFNQQDLVNLMRVSRVSPFTSRMGLAKGVDNVSSCGTCIIQ